MDMPIIYRGRPGQRSASQFSQSAQSSRSSRPKPMYSPSLPLVPRWSMYRPLQPRSSRKSAIMPKAWVQSPRQPWTARTARLGSFTGAQWPASRVPSRAVISTGSVTRFFWAAMASSRAAA